MALSRAVVVTHSLSVLERRPSRCFKLHSLSECNADMQVVPFAVILVLLYVTLGCGGNAVCQGVEAPTLQECQHILQVRGCWYVERTLAATWPI